jgi:hypothetical protein
MSSLKIPMYFYPYHVVIALDGLFVYHDPLFIDHGITGFL